MARCGAATAEVAGIAERLTPGEFRSHVEGLAQITGALTAYLEHKPERILLAHALPQNLEQLVQMLRQYAELSRFPSPGVTVAEALNKVEANVSNAHLAFEGMYQQLLDNDVAALEASARALEFLLGMDAELQHERRKRETGRLPELRDLPAGPAGTRPQHLEKPL